MFLVPITIQAQIIHVPAIQPTIQAGIDVALTGDTVLVSDGTYFENIYFNGKAITLASHFLLDGDTSHISNTIIDGSQPDNPNNGSVVYFTSGEDTTSILCGFTIQNGTGTYPDAWADRSGAGIYLSESTAKIIHNKIHSNNINSFAGAFGGGIAVNTMNDMWVVIRNNTIMDNTAQSSQEKSEGGGIYTMCNAIIKNNLIESNLCASTAPLYSDAKAFGGGISLVNYSNASRYVYVMNNIIQYNIADGLPRGGGMAIYKLNGLVNHNVIRGDTIKSDFVQRGWGCGLYLDGTYLGMDMGLVIEKNEISGNTFVGNYIAGGGIAMYDMDLPFNINANIIMNNKATYGAGICSKLTYCVEITNNIIKGNEAGLRGGGLFFTSDEFSSCENRSDDRYNETDRSNESGDRSLFPLLINNTITGNQAYIGGGMASEQTLRYIICFNDIFWGNTATQGEEIHLDDNCAIELDYCDIDTNLIYGNWSGGQGIINVDPLFCDDSCHIDFESLCLDAGIGSNEINGTSYYAPDLDIDGQPRPLNAGFEIGADEILGVNIRESGNEMNRFYLINFPNPFTENTTINYELEEGTQVRIMLYSKSGQLIRTMVNEQQAPGTHHFMFNAEDLHPGVYIYQLKTPVSRETNKLVIIK